MLALLKILWSVFSFPMAMGFFGIGQGPSDAEKQQYRALNQSSQFATGLGERDVIKASDFMDAILSGDASRISSVLAPQINAAKKSAQEVTKTGAEFGTRGGGTGASTAAANDKVHSEVTDMIAHLTGSSASGLATMGSDLLGKGMSGTGKLFDEAKTMQQQSAAKIGDIFKSATGVASAAMGIKKRSGGGGGGAPSGGDSGDGLDFSSGASIDAMKNSPFNAALNTDWKDVKANYGGDFMAGV